MKTRMLRWMLGLLFFVTGFASARAVPPKDGRYKGTLTLRVAVDGTKTEVKKIFSITGVLAGGTMQAGMLEVPSVGSYFTGPFFDITVDDGSLTMRPNNNALSLSLSEVKTAVSSLKGSVDMGSPTAVNGSISPHRRFLSLIMTRVGN
jgi:hypothetical protein